MLSRVANNLFWMDRYMERSYGLLNLIKTNYNSTLDSGDLSSWNKIMQSYLGVRPETEFKNHQDSIVFNFFKSQRSRTDWYSSRISMLCLK